jgi:hypothetical protein
LESPQKLFYARHRPTEAYFWALGVYYEPQYAEARKLLAKFIATITPYDDTFDNYGIWEELQPFADVMQRFAIPFLLNNQMLEATVLRQNKLLPRISNKSCSINLLIQKYYICVARCEL